MSSQIESNELIKRYLLGELSEQEREQVEQRLMSEDDLYQQLLLAEDDLIDDYISGALSERDRAKFGGRFLHVPELRQDVQSVKALRQYALQRAPQVHTRDSPAPAHFSLFDWFGKFFMLPAVGATLAGMLLATVMVVAWFAAQNSRLRGQVEQLQAQQPAPPASQQGLQEQLASERVRNEQLSAELLRQQELLAEESRKLQQAQGQRPPAPAPAPEPRSRANAVFAFTLTSGGIRGPGQFKKISLPPETREVRLRLDLATAEYSSYRAVLQNSDGQDLLTERRLPAGGGKFVQLNVPAKLLKRGDYQVLLSGVNPSGEAEEIDNYYFRVLP
ncbi:MAG TPA: hypothetical protein VGO96_18425 [Pyrinomonadaceae bacterium]|jgi:hypothetical protein|nr:hypothetical protein [Pyrinomonadaceae bacterium]